MVLLMSMANLFQLEGNRHGVIDVYGKFVSTIREQTWRY